ncbi:MAG: hypothetical protein DI600_00280 [Cutibacterium granulosum]|nr:MAG: hypothetical protein DI600_00280 [Cutibacterium granulosum]
MTGLDDGGWGLTAVRTSSVPTNALVRTDQVHELGGPTIMRTVHDHPEWSECEPACGEKVGRSSNVLI